MSEQYDHEAVIANLKGTIIEKLKDFTWLESMRLKCRAYIKNNGTKIISVEEIQDFLIAEALGSFPKSLREEICEEIDKIIANWFN